MNAPTSGGRAKVEDPIGDSLAALDTQQDAYNRDKIDRQVSLLGGLVGIALGFAASSSISQYLRWSTSISPGAVVLAVGIAASVGIFFGWYPARQAARLDPIQSLRYE